MNLLKKIKNKDVKVAVIGLGYVGLPLAVEFAKAGFSVIGIDTDRERLAKVRNGRSYIEDVPDKAVKKLCVTDDYSNLKDIGVIIICVPTPLRKTKQPDISYVIKAARKIERYMDGPQLVILESTTYPGTTEEIILPVLSQKDRKAGRDFFLAYSPERVDPGNKKYGTADIPKVVAGITADCLKLISSLYNHVFKVIVPVSSTEVAETIKLLENTFRTVNIALVDEIALMCHKMGIDVWEVIRGAATKPFGFMPFYPGPGVGGACLPKDPIYLAWRARHHGFDSRFIALASDITTSMPGYIVERIKGLLKKPLRASRILVLGVAYKGNIGDTRDSPALEIIKRLRQKGAQVFYNDPYVPKISVNGRKYRSVKISKELLRGVDLAVITTAHAKYDLNKIVKYTPLVFDTRGVTWGRQDVVRL